MNVLDVVIAIAIVVGVAWGWRRGILAMAASLISLIAGIYFASIYYGAIEGFLMRQFGASPTTGAVIGFAAVFVAVMLAVAWLGGLLAQAIRAANLGWVDRLGGGVFGAVLGALVVGLIVLSMTTLMPSDAPTLRNSELAPRVLAYDRALIGFIPVELRDAFDRGQANLVNYWKEHGGLTPAQETQPSASVTR